MYPSPQYNGNLKKELPVDKVAILQSSTFGSIKFVRADAWKKYAYGDVFGEYPTNERNMHVWVNTKAQYKAWHRAYRLYHAFKRMRGGTLARPVIAMLQRRLEFVTEVCPKGSAIAAPNRICMRTASGVKAMAYGALLPNVVVGGWTKEYENWAREASQLTKLAEFLNSSKVPTVKRYKNMSYYNRRRSEASTRLIKNVFRIGTQTRNDYTVV